MYRILYYCRIFAFLNICNIEVEYLMEEQSPQVGLAPLHCMTLDIALHEWTGLTL